MLTPAREMPQSAIRGMSPFRTFRSLGSMAMMTVSSITVPKIRRVRTIAAESIPAAPNSLTNTPAEPHSAPDIAGRARYALLNGSPIQRVPIPSRSGGSRGYIHCTFQVPLWIPAGLCHSSQTLLHDGWAQDPPIIRVWLTGVVFKDKSYPESCPN